MIIFELRKTVLGNYTFCYPEFKVFPARSMSFLKKTVAKELPTIFSDGSICLHTFGSLHWYLAANKNPISAFYNFLEYHTPWWMQLLIEYLSQVILLGVGVGLYSLKRQS